MKEFRGIIQLLKKFPTEDHCRKYLERSRWNGNPFCPFKDCSHTKVYSFSDKKRYKCAKCRKIFSVTVGTIFENSKVPLKKWFTALYLVTSHKKGISSIQLGKDLNVTQKTAWFMLHRIRNILKEESPGIMEGIVELDETFVGGKMSNKPKQKRAREWFKSKTPVFGILGRGQVVRAFVVKNVGVQELIPHVLRNAKPNTLVITDQHGPYKRLQGYYKHIALNHEKGHFVAGEAHTNNIEGFWSHLKRGIIGVYHFVSPQHLQRYCDAFCFRYNTRDLSEYERFLLALQNCTGRLKYKELTATGNYIPL